MSGGGAGPCSALAPGALLLLAAAWACGADPSASREARELAVKTAYEQRIYPFLATHCLSCHGAKKQNADIDFSLYEKGSIALLKKHLWRSCVEQLASRAMPPEKERQPSEEERRLLADWLVSLRSLAPPDPGPSPIRRLSRAEYANTLRDLLGVDPAVADDLPSDTVGPGFNSAIAPLLMEKYLLVADEVLDQLIRPEQMRLAWKAGQLDALIGGALQAGAEDGGERRIVGPGQITGVFPAPIDGTYTIRIRAGADRLGREPARLALRLGTRVVGEIRITAGTKSPANHTLTCRLPTGRTPLALIVANPLVEAPPAPVQGGPGAPARPGAPPKPGQRPPAAPKPAAPKPGTPAAGEPRPRTVVVESIEIIGPAAAPPSEVQRRLLVATPGPDLAKREAARRIATAFARKAYRRPATAGEIEVLLTVFDLADAQEAVFSDAVKLMLKAVLVSPQFLFIAAETGADGAPGAILPVGDHQLAARLSYLFWATLPDDELAALADAGTLRAPGSIERQVRRLIADPRADALFAGFGAQWLGLDRLETLPVDEKKFPLMTSELRRAMYAEAALVFGAVLREDRSLLELFDCDFTFVNASLARIYGLDGAAAAGPQMRRVQLDDANRGGVLTMPGVLAVTSLPGRTSPVKRGAWVLERVLGQAAPPPPMNVAPLEGQDTPENAALSLRQRTERHRADPACAGCHRVLDPIGFGLENFDAIGRWREQDDTGRPVDPVGELPGKVVFRSPRDLKRIVLERKDEVCRALVGRLLAYALCRTLEDHDEVVADGIAAAVAKDGYRLQTALVLIATSYPFLNRRATP